MLEYHRRFWYAGLPIWSFLTWFNSPILYLCVMRKLAYPSEILPLNPFTIVSRKPFTSSVHRLESSNKLVRRWWWLWTVLALPCAIHFIQFSTSVTTFLSDNNKNKNKREIKAKLNLNESLHTYYNNTSFFLYRRRSRPPSSVCPPCSIVNQALMRAPSACKASPHTLLSFIQLLIHSLPPNEKKTNCLLYVFGCQCDE